MRARQHVDAVCAFGPQRHVGTVNNEQLTPAYLQTQLATVVAAADGRHRVEVDVQRPTGSFDLAFLDGMASSYSNVTNIAVRLTPLSVADPASLPAVLLRYSNILFNYILLTLTATSSHFDATIGALGASDDMAGVAVGLEVLRALVAGPALPNAVLMLFNGAEETILQAAHGFATQHPW